MPLPRPRGPRCTQSLLPLSSASHTRWFVPQRSCISGLLPAARQASPCRGGLFQAELCAVRSEERLYDRDAVLGRDVSSVFPTEISMKAAAESASAAEAIGGRNFITEKEVHITCCAFQFSSATEQ